MPPRFRRTASVLLAIAFYCPAVDSFAKSSRGDAWTNAVPDIGTPFVGYVPNELSSDVRDADFGGALDDMRGLSGRIGTRPAHPPAPRAACPLPVLDGPDPDAASDCGGPRFAVASRAALPARPSPAQTFNELSCGEPCMAGPRPRPRASGEPAPINAGFRALGPTGAGGEVDGPGKKGNGRYRVLLSDPHELQLEVATGYMEGVFTMKRDPASGADTMRFAGRLWDQDRDAWGAAQDATSAAQIAFDAKRNRGVIRYNDEGRWKQEGYWDGKNGRRMVIEFGGGWDHTFYRVDSGR